MLAEVRGRQPEAHANAVPRLGAPREPSKLGSGIQELNSEELSSLCVRVWFWACACSSRVVTNPPGGPRVLAEYSARPCF